MKHLVFQYFNYITIYFFSKEKAPTQSNQVNAFNFSICSENHPGHEIEH
jgi:hypothetical protein